MLTCSTLRGATVVAIALFLAAWLVEALLPHSVTTSYLALLLLALSTIIFVGTLLLSIIPGAGRRLVECEH